VAGELCVSGVSLARGYLNRPELTHKKFELPLTLYHTGDLARWLPDGNIEFLGRIDHQVKVRGFRIELGEIENQLLRHPVIKEAVVVSPVNREKERYLAAYIVVDKELPSTEVKEFLSLSLPHYMVPPYITILDQIPLTASGKVNRKALPEPETDIQESYQAPRDETERELVKLWSDLLGRDALHAGELKLSTGINDNFFALGGHSLKVALLAAGIHRLFDVKMSLMELFESPTIKDISRYIREARREEHIPIEPSEEKEYYLLSSAQRRLYVLHQMEKESIGYNLPALLMLEGHVDKRRLEDAFNRLIQRHESLRTSFIMLHHQPMQRVHDHVEFRIEFFRRGTSPWVPLPGNHCVVNSINPDGNNINPGGNNINGGIDDNNQGTHRGVPLQSQRDFIRPFNLSDAPLLRVGLIREQETKHILMVDMHHIISDGTSVSIMITDFIALYGGEELPAQPLQYKDFTQWRNSQNQKKQLQQQETYWLNAFEGDIPVLDLPADYSRPRVRSFEGGRIYFEIDKERADALKEYALKEGVTLYIVLLSLYTIFLSRVTSQEDIVVGTPVAGRNHADLETIIGMFVNTLPLRNYPSGRETVTRFIQKVKGRTITAFDNQDYMYEELVETLVKDRDTSRNPLFDTMFVLQSFRQENLELPDLTLKQYEYEWKVAKFDLTLEAIETGGTLAFAFDYCTRLFKEDTILRFARYFKNILSGALNNPRMRLMEMGIIPGEEKRQVLYDFNDTDAPYPSGKTIHQLFEEQAERTPDAVAVVGTEGTLSYRELSNQSHRLAKQLNEKGVRIDTIVAIMVDRCLEMIIGKLGIFKAGGAFLPIDPEYPEERIDYMLRDSGSNVLVSGLDGLVVKRLDASDQSTRKPINRQTNKPTNLAYVIYTSGSTGKPKGVLVEHRNLLHYLHSFNNQFKITSGDSVVQQASYSFDVFAE
ncbi:MAG: AMP-binding protein, partial [bacterium]|nr:AMP-binding protein [bacterium]